MGRTLIHSGGNSQWQVKSDQHFEIYGLPQLCLAPEADVFVCAGDLMREPAQALRWLADTVPMPTIYVAGNHEYYRGSYTEWRDEGAVENGNHPNVHLLEDHMVVIDGVRFIGSTLWTDYALFGQDTVETAKFEAWRRMNDFNLIRYSNQSEGRPWLPEPLTPDHLAAIHERSVKFLDHALAEPFSGKTVVVTHHAPHRGSIHERYHGNVTNPAFVSDLSKLIEHRQPDLWIHGHVHSSFDYFVKKTRIICNPQGYRNENPAFEPELIVEI